MKNTKIEYLDATWNPLAMRCDPVSEGCAHCWHLRMCGRLAGNTKLPLEIRLAYAGDREPLLVEERLDEPLRMTKSRVIGVQFMGDLFHPAVDFKTIWQIYAVMQRAEMQTFLVLTKRVDRALEFYNWLSDQFYETVNENWFTNIWFGTTIENQLRAEERVEKLLQIPAAHRYLSIEPLLDWINFSKYLWEEYPTHDGNGFEPVYLGGIDWVVCGPETGPSARGLENFEIRARDLRDQCIGNSIPFFLKKNVDGTRLLDGREWNEKPF